MPWWHNLALRKPGSFCRTACSRKGYPGAFYEKAREKCGDKPRRLAEASYLAGNSNPGHGVFIIKKQTLKTPTKFFI